jgi:hypothetical protein
MDKTFGNSKAGKIFTGILAIIGGLSAIAALIWVTINISSVTRKLSATIETNPYSLPFEIRSYIEHFDFYKADTVFRNSIKSEYGLLFMDTLFKQLKNIESFDRFSRYCHELTLRNKGRKNIRDVKVSAPYLGGYYQYVDDNNNSFWGNFSNSITIQSIEPKSSLSVILYSSKPIFDEKDIKISYPDNVLYPKRLYKVKGFLGFFLTADLNIQLMLICPWVIIFGVIGWISFRK